jgi:putative transposase
MQVKIHRPIEGTIKTCTIGRSQTGKWFASFSCECDPKPLPASTESIGIDVGLHSFAVLSNGETIPNPRFFHEYERRLAKSQRKMEKHPKGSFERSKKQKVVSHTHERISNLRSDFAHKKSKEIVDGYGIICIEDLAIHRMIRNKQYSKMIQDAAWGQFAFCLSYKAANAGRIVIASDPPYTSQECNICRSRNHEFIGRMFHCLDCDNLIDRDHNAAINIERLGLQSLGLTKIHEAPSFS